MLKSSRGASGAESPAERAARAIWEEPREELPEPVSPGIRNVRRLCLRREARPAAMRLTEPLPGVSPKSRQVLRLSPGTEATPAEEREAQKGENSHVSPHRKAPPIKAPTAPLSQPPVPPHPCPLHAPHPPMYHSRVSESCYRRAPGVSSIASSPVRPSPRTLRIPPQPVSTDPGHRGPTPRPVPEAAGTA